MIIFLLIFLCLAIFGHGVVKWLLKKIEGSVPPVNEEIEMNQYFNSLPVSPNIDNILKAWGETRKQHLPDENINHEIVNLFSTYSFVGPDRYGPYLSVKAVQKSKIYPSFVKIGKWDEDCDLFVREGKTDFIIYKSNKSQVVSFPNQPSKLANNINEFLIRAWKYHCDAESVSQLWYNRLWLWLHQASRK